MEGDAIFLDAAWGATQKNMFILFRAVQHADNKNEMVEHCCCSALFSDVQVTGLLEGIAVNDPHCSGGMAESRPSRRSRRVSRCGRIGRDERCRCRSIGRSSRSGSVTRLFGVEGVETFAMSLRHI